MSDGSRHYPDWLFIEYPSRRTICGMVVYGEADRPRVVAHGFTRTHPFAAVIERYAGTVHYLLEDSNVRWESWDAVVALGDPNLFAKHVRVLQIGGYPDGHTPQTYDSAALTMADNVGTEIEVPDDLPDDLRELVKRSLLPFVDPGVHRRRIAPYRLAAGSSVDVYRPLLRDLDGYAFAALYRPPRGLYECLYLPESVVDIAPWLLYAFRRWSEELPDVFPSQPDWTSDSIWMTALELSAQADVTAKRAEEARVIAEQRALVADAEASLAAIRGSVDASERLLLTADGTPLAEIVHQTLESFGFEVTDVDGGLAERQAKKEDLRVSDGGRLALCEVKGYSKGAKLNDLGQLNRFSALYAVETGHLQDAMWFVANHFRGNDPGSRPQLLQGADEDAETFGQQGGLIIDTRDLFQLRKALASGSISEEEVRAMLTGSAGRFELPDDFGLRGHDAPGNEVGCADGA